MKRKYSDSPPPIPATEFPSTRKQCRFVDNGFASEWSEEYRPGGLHPVHIDDEFDHGRYRVLRKLGNGSYSTVWLASDAESHNFVALKILRAKESGENNGEKLVYDYLAANANELSEHVVELLDHFQITGPNGNHICLVFEPMGPSSASMAAKLPCNKSLHFLASPRYPKAMAKMMLKKALSGIAFLHKHGITHADVQPGNLLFSLPELDNDLVDELRQDKATLSKPLRRRDGKTDLWAPKHLALAQSLCAQVRPDSPSTTVKLSDLGAAFWTSEPPASTVTPTRLRAPELIFGEPFGSGIDIWAFGCLIYEFLTGESLISAADGGPSEEDRQDTDDDHILDLNDVLGPLPDALMKKWTRKEKWIGPDGERLQPGEPDHEEDSEAGSEDEMSESNTDAEGEPEEQDLAEDLDNRQGEPSELQDAGDGAAPPSPLMIAGFPDYVPGEPFINKPLEELFAKNKSDEIDEKEAKVITTLIREILRYDPSERPTAEELLKHSWFQEQR